MLSLYDIIPTINDLKEEGFGKHWEILILATFVVFNSVTSKNLLFGKGLKVNLLQMPWKKTLKLLVQSEETEVDLSTFDLYGCHGNWFNEYLL